MELLELQQDLGLHMTHKYKFTNKFWKNIQEIMNTELEKTNKLMYDSSHFSVQ